MSDCNSFYNDAKQRCLTYLEFGSIDTETSEKRIWDFRLHQEAYDFLMLARYMKDLVAFKKLSTASADWSIEQQVQFYLKTVYTHDIYNSFSKLAALHVVATQHRPASFLELGSTLMGCIEALAYIQKLGNSVEPSFSTLDLHAVSYHAVDISELLNSAAIIIHPDYQLHSYLNWKLIDFSYDVFFAKGVSMLYALSTPEELAANLGRCRIGTFDFSFAVGTEQEQYLGTGKNVKYLSAEQCLKTLSSLIPERDLYIHRASAEFDRSKNRLRGVFVFANEIDLQSMIKEEARLRDAISAKLPCSLRKHLYYRDLEAEQEYVELSKYMESI